MEILRLNTHGFVMKHCSCMNCSRPSLSLIRSFNDNFLSFYSSPSNNEVIIGENGSMLTLNVTRWDNQIKYQCEIFNAALVRPIRLEQELHVKCKHRRNK